jgi:hypothetical protein
VYELVSRPCRRAVPRMRKPFIKFAGLAAAILYGSPENIFSLWEMTELSLVSESTVPVDAVSVVPYDRIDDDGSATGPTNCQS